MAGPLHFVAIVALAAITFVTVKTAFDRPSWQRVAVAALAPFGFVALFLFSVHACDAGQPLWQWLGPTLCACAAILFVGDRRARALLVMGAVAVSLGLSLHFAEAVHGAEWVGNPASMTVERGVAAAEWHTPVTGLHRRPR